MVDELHGHLAGLTTKYEGATLVQDANPGDTVIYVDDVADFDETGGTLRVADGDGVFMAARTYTAIDDDAGTVTLATGLPSSTFEGSVVRILAADGTYAQTAEASVVSDDGSPPVTVDVLHTLIPLLDNAVRAGVQESVVCRRERNGVKWMLIDVLGAAPQLAAPHGERGRSTDLSIPDSTPTLVIYNSSPILRGGLQVASGVWTVPLDGRYLITATMQWEADAVGQRNLWFRVNGNETGAQMRVDAASSGVTALSVSQALELSDGDQITVMVSQSSGGTLHVLEGSTVTVTGLD